MPERVFCRIVTLSWASSWCHCPRQREFGFDALRQDWQDGVAMNESEKQFSFTRAASSTSGRARKQFPISMNVSATIVLARRLERAARRERPIVGWMFSRSLSSHLKTKTVLPTWRSEEP